MMPLRGGNPSYSQAPSTCDRAARSASPMQGSTINPARRRELEQETCHGRPVGMGAGNRGFERKKTGNRPKTPKEEVTNNCASAPDRRNSARKMRRCHKPLPHLGQHVLG